MAGAGRSEGVASRPKVRCGSGWGLGRTDAGADRLQVEGAKRAWEGHGKGTSQRLAQLSACSLLSPAFEPLVFLLPPTRR